MRLRNPRRPNNKPHCNLPPPGFNHPTNPPPSAQNPRARPLENVSKIVSSVVTYHSYIGARAPHQSIGPCDGDIARGPFGWYYLPKHPASRDPGKDGIV